MFLRNNTNYVKIIFSKRLIPSEIISVESRNLNESPFNCNYPKCNDQ